MIQNIGKATQSVAVDTAAVEARAALSSAQAAQDVMAAQLAAARTAQMYEELELQVGWTLIRESEAMATNTAATVANNVAKQAAVNLARSEAELATQNARVSALNPSSVSMDAVMTRQARDDALALVEADRAWVAETAQVASALEVENRAAQEGAAANRAYTTETLLAAEANKKYTESLAVKAEGSTVAAEADAAKVAAANIASAGAAAAASGTAILAIGAALAGAELAALKFSAQYQQAMVIVQAATQATAAQMQGLTTGNEKLASSFGQPITNSAKMEAEMVRDGVSIQNVIDGAARSATTLARATGNETAPAVKLLAQSMNAWNITGAESSKIADAWTYALNNSTLTATTASTQFAPLTGAIKSINGSFLEEVAAMTAVAQSGDAAGRSALDLTRVITSLINPSNEQIAALNALGVATHDVAGNWLSLDQIIRNFQAGLAGTTEASAKLTEAQREQNAVIAIGQQGVRTLGASADALKTLGDNYERARAGVQNYGSAAQIAAQSQQSLNAQIGIFFAVLGSGVNQSGAVQWLTDVATAINRNNAAADALNEHFAEVEKIMRAQKISYAEASAQIAIHERAMADDNDEANSTKYFADLAAKAENAEGNAAAASIPQHQSAATAASLHAAALRDLANAARDAAAAQGQAIAAAGEAQAQIIKDQAKGTSADPVQQARNNARADTEAAIAKGNAIVGAADRQAEGVSAAATQTALDEAKAAGYTQEAWEKAFAAIDAAQIKTTAERQKAQAEAQNLLGVADAAGQASIREAIIAQEKKGNSAAAQDQRTINSAEAAADRETTTMLGAYEKQRQALDKLEEKARDAFNKMEAAHTQAMANIALRTANAIANINNELANSIEKLNSAAVDQIKNLQAAAAQALSDRARQEALTEKIQAQTTEFNKALRAEADAYSDLNDKARAAFQTQQEAATKALKDQQDLLTLQHDYNKELQQKGIDPASLAKGAAERLSLEQQQLARATTQQQRNQIIANYNLNEQVSAAQTATLKTQIDKDQAVRQSDADFQATLEQQKFDLTQKQQADQVAFNIKMRGIQEAQQDAMDLERLAFEKKIDKERQDLQDQIAAESLARQEAAIGESLKRQVAEANSAAAQRILATNNAAQIETQILNANYAQQVKDRQEALRDDYNNLVASYDLQNKLTDQHMLDQVNALARNDARVADRARNIGNDLIDQANQTARAFYQQAVLSALALHLPPPPAFVPVEHDTAPFTVPTFHEGGVVGGLPGQQMLALLQAGEIVVKAGFGAGRPSVYHQNSVSNNNYSFSANYAKAQEPIELQHDITAIMALAKGR